ncbi:hypothetical protein CNR27_13745 [Luteimonas chenhongjianii]|uniref:Transposase n=1 Tax=Luteimonas chenhongjianii TaxID=2006110 RepID=A0A290XH06_9GAMM|nr:hypothetical protein CNR27_13745 [Luteimonas chenhongjianii]
MDQYARRLRADARVERPMLLAMMTAVAAPSCDWRRSRHDLKTSQRAWLPQHATRQRDGAR